MKHLSLPTSHGPIHVVGRLMARADNPAVVAVSGAFPPPDFLHDVVDWFSKLSIVVAPIPGMHGTRTLDFDLARVSRALDEAIQTLLPNRRIVTLGVSAGALVTLGLRHPAIVHQVVVEPFFRTAPLWPVRQDFGAALADAEAGWKQAADEIFGVTAEGLRDRDYRPLLDGLTVPVDAVLGGVPLEPERRLPHWPSLTSVEDRAALAAHPRVSVHHVADVGHNVMSTAQGAAATKALLAAQLRPLARP